MTDRHIAAETGYTSQEITTGTWSIVAGGAALATKADGTTTTEATFEAAVTAAGEGGYVTLLKNVENSYALAKDGSLQVKKDGYTVTISPADETYNIFEDTDPVTGITTYTTGTAVASITTGEETKYYPTLQAAYAAATANDEIKLLKTIEIDNEVIDNTVGIFNIEKPVTINGQNNTIKVKSHTATDSSNSGHVFNVLDTAKGTVFKNLTIEGGADASTPHAHHGIHAYGSEVTIEDVEVKYCFGYGVVANGSKVEATGLKTSNNGWGGVNADTRYSKDQVTYANASVTLGKDCVLSDDCSVYAEKYNQSEAATSTVTIKSGSYKRILTGVGANVTISKADSVEEPTIEGDLWTGTQGTTTISAGTFKGIIGNSITKGSDTYQSNGTFTITGGTFEKEVGTANNGIITISSGYFNDDLKKLESGSTTASGGYYKKAPKDEFVEQNMGVIALTEDSKQQEDATAFSNGYKYKIDATTAAEASITTDGTTVYYEKLEDAVKDANNTKTIKLLKEKASYTLEPGKKVILATGEGCYDITSVTTTGENCVVRNEADQKIVYETVAATASVKKGDTETPTYYTSLKDAIDAVNSKSDDGYTVTLLKNDEASDSITVSKANTTVDLNGKTLKLDNSENITVAATGTNKIENGTIDASESTAENVLAFTSGTNELSNCIVKVPTTGTPKSVNVTGGDVTIKSGTYEEEVSPTNDKNKLKVKGGTYYIDPTDALSPDDGQTLVATPSKDAANKDCWVVNESVNPEPDPEEKTTTINENQVVNVSDPNKTPINVYPGNEDVTNGELTSLITTDKLDGVKEQVEGDAEKPETKKVDVKVYLDVKIDPDKTTQSEVTFDVTPMMKETITPTTGTTKTTETKELSNDDIKNITFKFRLYLDAYSALFKENDIIKVVHKGTDFTETYYLKVQAENGRIYVLVTTGHFSSFTAVAVGERNVTVKLDSGIENVTLTYKVDGADQEKEFTSNGTEPIPNGASVTITATAKEKYRISTITYKPTPNSTETTISTGSVQEIVGEATISATSSYSGGSGGGGGTVPTTYRYTLALSSSPAGATLTGAGTYSYAAGGTAPTATATASDMTGYTFTGWQENGTTVSTSKSYNVTMNRNVTLVAVYTKVEPTTAEEFVKEVNALPKNPTSADRAAVDKALADYKNVPDADKTKADVVAAKKALDSANDAVTADEVADKIEALPKNPTLSDKAAVEAARKAYDALTADQKKLVPTADVTALENAEKAIKQAEEDKTKADAADKLIKALPASPTLSDKDQVAAAKKAYDDLTAAQQALVPEEDVKKLNNAVKAIEEAEKEKAEADKKAAKAVEDLIKGLPDPANVTSKDKAAIEAVKKQYDALTPDQQALVSDASKTKLQKDIDALQSEDQKVVERFTAAVNAVPGSEPGTEKALLDFATDIYNEMTDAQKAIVTRATMNLYQDELDHFKRNYTFRDGDAWFKVLTNGDVTYLKPASRSITSASVPEEAKDGSYRYRVIKVSNNAFRNCKSLKWVVVAKTVYVFGQYVFARTPKLATVKVMGTNFKSPKATDAFFKAGKSSGLTVKAPKSKVSSYSKLFKGEGRLNGEVIAA